MVRATIRGADAFRRFRESCGYFEVPIVPLNRSSEVDAAFAELVSVLDNVARDSAAARKRGEAEEDESIGYYLAPPTADAGLIRDLRDVLPAQVEGLYAILDTLDIFTTSGAGGKSDEPQRDYVLIQPLKSLEDVSNDGHGDFWTLHIHDMGRFLCFNRKGELWTWSGFEPEPKLAAPDVAAYLRSLATKYQ